MKIIRLILFENFSTIILTKKNGVAFLNIKSYMRIGSKYCKLLEWGLGMYFCSTIAYC